MAESVRPEAANEPTFEASQRGLPVGQNEGGRPKAFFGVNIEERWAEAAKRGESEAFNNLVNAYQRLVFNLALRTLGNLEEAADATQETFIKALNGIGGFRGGPFKPWLMRIAANECYDLLRRRKRAAVVSLENLVENDPNSLPSSTGAGGTEMLALGAETVAKIQAGLGTLPEDQRIVLVLCDVQGMDYGEAAEAMQCSVGTVKSRLSRARAKLRDYLLARGELPGGLKRL